MILIEIKNKATQQITNRAKFETLLEAQDWITKCELEKAFGEPEHFETDNTVEPPVENLVLAEYEILITENYVDQAAVNAEALAYLRKTDWYVIRELDNGTPMPDDIKANRQAARERVIV